MRHIGNLDRHQLRSPNIHQWPHSASSTHYNSLHTPLFPFSQLSIITKPYSLSNSLIENTYFYQQKGII